MTTMRFSHLDDCSYTPWRNGGGVTRDLLSWPVGDPADDGADDGSGDGDWQLRVSVAEIERDGPFSAWPGVDRWFAPVAGAGVELRFDPLHGGTMQLTESHEVLAFAGELAPSCRLLAGATQDLNLFVRRGAGHGAMSVAGSAPWISSAPWRGVYVADAATLSVAGGAPVTLAAGTLAWIADGAADATWRLVSAVDFARAWWIAYTPGARSLRAGVDAARRVDEAPR